MPANTSTFDTATEHPPSTSGLLEPSAELLHRALVGWERFLRTFEGRSDD
ncbi:hypothetical protein [Streptomyces sp. Isolate_45]|nr:hypothetical protein [Streptomyces sp. Isolate_45]MDA5285862.1 hypothetical protein [Streptomyces sp. Isolate_45]